MRNLKHEYNNLFDKISSTMSDTELLSAALRKAENMENNRSRRMGKPMTIMAIAAAVAVCGVTAAAATGLLNFDDIFGRTLVAESEELGYELVGDALDVVITCSDSNYIAVLNGVTGTADSCLASVEFSRKDGGYIGRELHYASSGWSCTSDDGEVYSGGGARYCELVDSRVYCESVDMGKLTEADDYSLAGKRIKLEYIGFDNNRIDTPIDVTIEFTYIPSEKSLEQIELTDLDIQCEILYNITSYVENPTFPTGRDIPLETVITAIDLRPEKGALSGNILLSDFSMPDYSVNTFMCKNDVVLVKKDGNEIPVFLGGYHLTNDGEKLSFTMNIEYRGFNEQAGTAVDLTELAAIDFNGTVYNLV